MNKLIISKNLFGYFNTVLAQQSSVLHPPPPVKAIQESDFKFLTDLLTKAEVKEAEEITPAIYKYWKSAELDELRILMHAQEDLVWLSSQTPTLPAITTSRILIFAYLPILGKVPLEKLDKDRVEVFSKIGQLNSLLRLTKITKPFPRRIEFYNKKEPFYEFSNFYPAPVIHEDREFPTSENLFQFQKFTDSTTMDYLLSCETPGDSFRAARKFAHLIRPDWHQDPNPYKHEAMMIALRAKFYQHRDLFHLLMATRNAKIIEHTSRDNYWGDGGGEGRGLNMLGQMLMQLRETIFSSV